MKWSGVETIISHRIRKGKVKIFDRHKSASITEIIFDWYFHPRDPLSHINSNLTSCFRSWHAYFRESHSFILSALSKRGCWNVKRAAVKKLATEKRPSVRLLLLYGYICQVPVRCGWWFETMGPDSDPPLGFRNAIRREDWGQRHHTALLKE